MRLFINLTPLMHPEKSSIFQGTRLIPLSFPRRGGRAFREGQSPSLTYTPPSLKEVDEVLA